MEVYGEQRAFVCGYLLSYLPRNTPYEFIQLFLFGMAAGSLLISDGWSVSRVFLFLGQLTTNSHGQADDFLL